MIVSKLSWFNLESWQNSFSYTDRVYNHQLIPPRTRVCPCNNSKSLGIVVDIGPLKLLYKDRMRVAEVTVLWLTGKKKGKQEVKKTSDLTNYDAYKASVQKQLDELTKMEDEAKQTGL